MTLDPVYDELPRHGVAPLWRYYGNLWSESVARQRSAHAALRRADEALTSVEQAHNRKSGELARLRGRERELGTAVAEAGERLAAVEREFGEARHRLDLIDADFFA